MQREASQFIKEIAYYIDTEVRESITNLQAGWGPDSWLNCAFEHYPRETLEAIELVRHDAKAWALETLEA